MPAVLEALARIPRAGLVDARNGRRDPKNKGRDPKEQCMDAWSPATRPMGPVLRIGLHGASIPLVNKHVVVCEGERENLDDTLFVSVTRLDGEGVSL